MKNNSSFITKFKDRCQLVTKSGLISLGVHSVLKKELPHSKSYAKFDQNSDALNKTLNLVFRKEELCNPVPIPREKGSSLTLPPLQKITKKYSEKSLVPINQKHYQLNSSFTGAKVSSPRGANNKFRRDSYETRLNKSLILKY